jgi:DNA-binding beta-propeller fold protein YncE
MAPSNWDGEAKSVTCAYCKITFMPGAPPPAPMAQPRPTRGGGGAGCALAVVGGLALLVVGGAVAGFVMFSVRRPSSSPPIVVSVAPFPTPVVTKGVTAKKDDPPAALLSFGEEGTGAGQLTDARSIGVDMDENVYVADYSSGRVQKFDATGKFAWIVEVPKNTLSGDKNVWALVPDTKGTLWVSRSGDLIELALADGKLKGSVKGDYEDRWYRYLAMDPLGNMVTYHDARGDSDLIRLAPTGKVVTRVKNKDAGPLAMDGAGNVYRWEDGAVEVLDGKNAVKARFGSKKDPHTSSASAIAVDGKGHIFLAANGVHVFDEGGTFQTTVPFKGYLRSMAISVKGNLFLLDNQNKVTKIGPPTLTK